ncbi:hypothetical protein ACIQYO_20620 [Methylobacterium sp. NPDC097178]
MLFGQGDDRPLSCDWTADVGVLEPIGLTTPARRGQAQAKASILACLVTEKLGAGRRVAYSRDNNFYADTRDAPRYTGMAYSRDLVCRFIDALGERGLVVNGVAAPQPPREGEDPTKRMQSTCWATDELMALVGAGDVRHRRPGVPVVMRREDKSLVDLPDTDWARRMIRETESLNEWLERIDVTVGLDADPADWDVGPFHMKARKVRESGKVTWSTVVPTDPHVVRIISREHRDMGGRLYGFWQNLPKARRAELMINNELIIEPDFTCLHPTLLYSMQGIVLDTATFDPYLPHPYRWPRKAGKLALNVAINAKSIVAAVWALQAKRLEKGDDGLPKWRYGLAETRRIIDALIEHNKPIARYICSDMGVTLMGIDSRMCVEVLKRCRRDNVAVLPVHDSFMVGKSKGAVVTGHMAEVMDQTRTKLYSGQTRVYGLNVLSDATIASSPVPSLLPVVTLAAGADSPGLEGFPAPGADTPTLMGVAAPGDYTSSLEGIPAPGADTPALVGVAAGGVACPSLPCCVRGLASAPVAVPASLSSPSPVLAVPWASAGLSLDPRTSDRLLAVLTPPEPILMSSTTSRDPDPLPHTMTLDGAVVTVAGGLRRPYAEAELAAGRDPWAHLPHEARPAGEWAIVPRVPAGYLEGTSGNEAQPHHG